MILNFILNNWVDLSFAAVLVFFAMTNHGFAETFLESLGFVFSILFSYKTYSWFGGLIAAYFSLPHGIANAVGYFIGWFTSEVIFFLLINLMLLKFFRSIEKNPVNSYLGIVASFIQTCVIFLFFVSLIFAFPVRGQVKEAILKSHVGPFFVNASQSMERSFKTVFGDAVDETLNFMTIKPGSEESVNLGFKQPADKLSVDQSSEKIMFDLVNQERRQRGEKELDWDPALEKLARDYAREMMMDGNFSHTSAVDGSSPGERASRAGIEYMVEGENLAYAPDVYIAHQGLMNSPGHRANILSTDYNKVGIGVIDGGIYGRMFVQEFTN